MAMVVQQRRDHTMLLSLLAYAAEVNTAKHGRVGPCRGLWPRHLPGGVHPPLGSLGALMRHPRGMRQDSRTMCCDTLCRDDGRNHASLIAHAATSLALVDLGIACQAGVFSAMVTATKHVFVDFGSNSFGASLCCSPH